MAKMKKKLPLHEAIGKREREIDRERETEKHREKER